MIRLVCLFGVVALMSACSEYQKALKSEDSKLKYEMAERLYNEGNYKKANKLLEQIVPFYRGKPQAERVIFFHADTYYHLEDYYLAAYQFERFSKSYPQSEKAEYAAFKGAESYYMLSPRYSIDQTDTYEGIDKLQEFINRYPNSEYLSEANRMINELQEKLEKKDFEIAKQYNTIRDYKSSVAAFENFLKDYPGTTFREDALYYRYHSAYNLAIRSVTYRKEQRLKGARTYYDALIRYFPQTKYKEESEKMMATLQDEMLFFAPEESTTLE